MKKLTRENFNTLTKDYVDFKNRKSPLDMFADDMFFAFSKEQMEEGMKKVNASKDNKIVSIGYGGYILASKLNDYEKAWDNDSKMLDEKLKDNDFFMGAILYECMNHEYQISYQGDFDVMNCLGLENMTDTQKELYKKTVSMYMDYCLEYDLF